MSEELMKPGERQLKEMIPYIMDLIDNLNNLLAENEAILAEKGIARKLSVILSIITLHRYYPDVFMKEVWDQLLQTIDQLKQIPEVSGKLSDILNDIEKLNELKKEAGI
ncbi:hypothetical protein [Stygiolobus caldivivus]|uniref:Uncharacterized protein n=1 Tax=Stygiolobus caldivivus TaxID=2824673 RepID=A0A8D5U4W9_9CREN|nr:hypothetical protein [Stygiolobus caldivivus]BCU69140.1 hypothetical protein KN1_04370 [Stygiolobus caldivivus]